MKNCPLIVMNLFVAKKYTAPNTWNISYFNFISLCKARPDVENNKRTSRMSLFFCEKKNPYDSIKYSRDLLYVLCCVSLCRIKYRVHTIEMRIFTPHLRDTLTAGNDFFFLFAAFTQKHQRNIPTTNFYHVWYFFCCAFFLLLFGFGYLWDFLKDSKQNMQIFCLLFFAVVGVAQNIKVQSLGSNVAHLKTLTRACSQPLVKLVNRCVVGKFGKFGIWGCW